MFSIILVFILRESVDQSDNPTSRRNMNSRIVSDQRICSTTGWMRTWMGDCLRAGKPSRYV